MSVEASELTNESWTQWQGQVIDGRFPLGRFLGASDHGGVFLTHCAALCPSDVAIKLVPIDSALAETQLQRWKRAASILHPHLLKSLQWGECRLDGFAHVYLVMEYADQTLAQVLERRALTDEETKEMVAPVLQTLGFLHGRNLVHGRLKPENILVVGEELKLSSDTILQVGEGPVTGNPSTDLKEPRRSGASPAGDIGALGVCLFEALTRRAPLAWREGRDAPALPSDFSPVFSDIVTRCLDRNLQSRPTVTELAAWVGGGAVSAVPKTTPQAAAIEPPVSTTLERPPARIEPAPPTPEPAHSAAPAGESPNSLRMAIAIGATLVIIVVGWAAVHMANTRGTPTATPVPESTASDTSRVSAPVAVDAATSAPAAAPPSVLHEEIPEIPPGIRRNIRGHLKVAVRISVEPDGSVSAASVARGHNSKYFRRIAVEAARKWTFPRLDTQSRRVLHIQFDFARDETTARAMTLP